MLHRAVKLNQNLCQLLNLMSFYRPDCMEPELWMAFLGVAVLLTLSPGPDNLMVLIIGATQGRKAGLAFAMGCALGCLWHTLLAAIGLGVVMATMPPLLGGIKLIGAAYLAWLGLRILHQGSATDEMATEVTTDLQWFRNGLIANAVNPKVLLFFLALLPQFVRLEADFSPPLQLLLLGLVFTMQAIFIFGMLGWFSGVIGQYMRRYPVIATWLNRMAAAVFFILAIHLLL